MPDQNPQAEPLNPAGPSERQVSAGTEFVAARVDTILAKGSCPVVALCGSAGSLEALQEFFHVLPSPTGIAFVVVLHLSPTTPSSLPELLQHWTTLQVCSARHLQPVQADHIYVIPPGRYMTFENGHLHLGAFSTSLPRRLTIDVFLRSLAKNYGPRAAAVILSGADRDGSNGIQYIKGQGGVTMAQDPSAAVHATMPQSAIATGKIDDVLRPGQMPNRLIEQLGDPARLQQPVPVVIDDPVEGAQQTELARVLEVSLKIIRERTGQDYTRYRRSTLSRRLEHRVELAGTDDLSDYLSLLQDSQEEAHALSRDFLVSVTQFFRDPDHFDALVKVIPGLLSAKAPGEVMKVWVPGCATGEEAYSLAMLLIECTRRMDRSPAIQIFGTDLDAETIMVARSGLYPDAIREHVPPDRLQRFFVKEKVGYRARREVREAVLFAAHDVLKDAPFASMDLVSCRNLLIYLTGEAQRDLLRTLHYSLRPEGVLFLGAADRIEEPIFAPLDAAHKLYRRLPGKASARPGATAHALLLKSHDLRIADRGGLVGSAASMLVSSEAVPGEPRERDKRQKEDPTPADLRASNQELFVINQELRAASEELDLNRQELQCINEELTVLNQQLSLSIDELTRLNSDLKNFVDATDLGMIFLDSGLKIMRYTPAATRLFRLIPTDLGRPLADLRHQLRYDQFESEVRCVLTEGSRLEREIADDQGRWFLARFMPYRTIDQRIAGVVLTFVDITERKLAADSLRDSESLLAGQKEAFQAAMNNAPLNASLAVLVRSAVEQSTEVTRAAFYLLNREGTELHHVTGMPESYAECVRGFKVGPDSLACGLATYRGEPVFTPDVQHEPRWQPWLWLARQYDYRACWSFPVQTTGGPILGTLAWYFKEPRIPSSHQRAVAASLTHAAAIIISRHQEAEERFRAEGALRESAERHRAIVRATSDIVYKMSADWSEMQSLIGKDFISTTEQPRRDWMDAYIPATDQALVREVIDVAVRSKRIFELEHRVIRLDGTMGWVYSRAVPLFDQRGAIVEWFGAASDITHRKQAEAELKARNVELERFNQVMVGRELRMRDLKEEINRLHELRGDAPPYERPVEPTPSPSSGNQVARVDDV
ncbi:MAG: hypothetical protein ABS70_02030 [Nitrospira sp. SCN 59-13]|nr:MAG: hypothetical protein ABS70_02030 [Nitrospira sp. SCN 59-13]